MSKRRRSFDFDMPYHVERPTFHASRTGIDRMVMQGTEDISTLTSIDTVDHRLRSRGVCLIWSPDDGGCWTISSNRWWPLVPARKSWLAEVEIPTELEALIVPFTRGAIVAPRETLTRRTSQYALLDRHSRELGLLSDSRITITSYDVTVYASRHVRLECADDLDSDKRSAIIASLREVGGTPRDKDVSDEQLLTAQHIFIPDGHSDEAFDVFDATRSFFTDVSERLISVALAAQSSGVDRHDIISVELEALSAELEAWWWCLDNDWVAGLTSQIADAIEQPDDRDVFYAVASRIADAEVDPPLDGSKQAGDERARDAVLRATFDLVTKVFLLGDAISADSASEAWAELEVLCERLLITVDVCRRLLPKSRRKRAAVTMLRTGVAACTIQDVEPDDLEQARHIFVDQWPKTREALDKAWPAPMSDREPSTSGARRG